MGCVSFLLVDAIINCWCGVALSICMFSILFQEDNAKAVVMDALSLAFLQSIDDLTSDLGFLGPVWDSAKVGAFYGELRNAGIFRESGVEDIEDIQIEMESNSGEIEEFGRRGLRRLKSIRGMRITDQKKAESEIGQSLVLCADIIYGTAMVILVILVIVAIPAPF